MSNDLVNRTIQLQNEIQNIQDEIEFLLVLLDRKQGELDELHLCISDNVHSDNIAA